MRQNEKALLLSLISFLSLNSLCPKSAPEHIIIVQSSPGTHYFYSFLWEILPQTSKCPRTPLIFYYFCRTLMPRTTLYLAETARTPLFFIFLDKKFCPGLLRTCPGLGPGHRHPPCIIVFSLRMKTLDCQKQNVSKYVQTPCYPRMPFQGNTLHIKYLNASRKGGFTLYNVCSVHQGMFSTSGGYHEYIGGGYHEYIGGGDIMSTSGIFRTSGGYHDACGGASW